MTELFKNAFTGVNIIPTVLLILVVSYWIITIIGVLDFDLFDFDIDIEAGDGPFYALLAFLKVGDLPFMFVFSVLILNFWIIAMLMHYLPIAPGGVVNALLLIPALIFSMFITKVELYPLRFVKYSNVEDNKENAVIGQLCVLKCEVKDGRLGQAEIERDGASLVINVRSEKEEVSFRKDEIAFVIRKDIEKNLYYIVKNEGVVK